MPLLPGQCRDVRKLRLFDEKGEEVVAQFRELARWWRKDNSLRWVLVDFQTGVRGFTSRRFTLTGGAAKPHASPLVVEQTEDAIVVRTGVAEFTISRKRFNLFDRVRIDVDGDGKYTKEEEAVSPDPESGSVVEDTYGRKYFSAPGTAEVKVEEAGPVRVCVVARGVHRAEKGEGYSRGMYGYDVRMHFTAGTSMVRLDPVIHGCGPKPNGSPTFEDYSLVTRLNLKPEPNRNTKAIDRASPLVLARLYGRAPLDVELKSGQSVTIYQDSNGSETWRGNAGYGNRGIKNSSFRGYRIIRNGRDAPPGPVHFSPAQVLRMSPERFRGSRRGLALARGRAAG